MQIRRASVQAKAINAAMETRVLVWIGLLVSALVLLSTEAAWLPAT